MPHHSLFAPRGKLVGENVTWLKASKVHTDEKIVSKIEHRSFA